MNSRPICSICLRAFRRQARLSTAPPKPSNAPRRHASQATHQSPRNVRMHKSDKVSPAATQKPAERSPASKDDSQPPEDGSMSTASMVQTLRSRTPGFSETYVAYGVCELLVKECARVAEYTMPQAANHNEEIPKNERNEDIGVAKGWWYEELGLPPTFNSWARVTMLHLWCLTVRLRAFPAPNAGTWNQHLTDQFFYLAEDKMVLLHRLNSRAARASLLKELFHQWRGLTIAYDVGLVKGDAQLASAVWRNLCGGDMNVDFLKLAQVVAYMRSVLYNFDKMEDSVLARGDIVFEDPFGEEKLVKERSRLWDVKFDGPEPDSSLGGKAS